MDVAHETGRQAVQPDVATPEASASHLVVGPDGDAHERAADDVADQVVRALASPPPQSGNGRAQRSAVRRTASAPRLARSGGSSSRPARGQRIRRSARIGAEGGPIDQESAAMIESSRGKGRAMPGDVRRAMEGAFDTDFGRVRVHEGAEAADLNRRIQASAFTVGHDVFFRDGMPDTTSASGQRLMAHELAHVQQNDSGRVSRLMDLATYKTSTAGKYRGRSKASNIDADLTAYAALRDTDQDLVARKQLLDSMAQKGATYEAAKPGGARTPGVASLDAQIATELTYIDPAAESVQERPKDPTKAARAAVVGQDAYLDAVKAGHPIPPAQQTPGFDRLITSAMNAGDRGAIAKTLIADDLQKIKTMLADPSTDALLKQILTEILANENEIGFSEGVLSSGATVSDAKKKAAHGKDYSVDLNVSSNPEGSAERLSSLIHEMTHIAVQVRWENTVIHLAFDSDDSDQDVLALSAKRTQELSDLDSALTAGAADFQSGQVSLLRGKIAYPVTGKNTLKSYADTFHKKGDIPDDEYQRIMGLVQSGANNTLIEFDTVINQMWFLMQGWQIPATNPFVKKLKTVAADAHAYRTG